MWLYPLEFYGANQNLADFFIILEQLIDEYYVTREF